MAITLEASPFLNVEWVPRLKMFFVTHKEVGYGPTLNNEVTVEVAPDALGEWLKQFGTHYRNMSPAKKENES